MSEFTLVVVAGGSGTRMNANQKKAFIEINNEPILLHTLRAFNQHPKITERVVVLPEAELQELADTDSRRELKDYDGQKPLMLEFKNLGVTRLVVGGPRRQDSVMNGLWASSTDIKYVLVHDAARPFVTSESLDALMQKTIETGAAILAHPVRDTLKQADSTGHITATVSRENLWGAQTPQAFRRELLVEAFQKHNSENVTDEASLVALTGTPVELVDGGPGNFKITTPFDLKLAEALISTREA